MSRRRRLRSTSPIRFENGAALDLEATGNMAAVNSVNLVARVQGFLQEIDYHDGAAVKKGTKLVIEPSPTS